MKRKRIGVLISEVEGIYQKRILSGIIAKAYELNYDLLIFSTFVKISFIEKYGQGEINIINLVNLNKLDGLIVVGGTFFLKNLRENIDKLLETRNDIPVVNIGNEGNYNYVTTDDETAFEKIVDHLIETHGFTDIMCLACPESLSGVTKRVNGYKNSLKKHNIEIKENNILYDGDYWYTGGENLASRFISGELRMPQAVACLSDHMAIGLVRKLSAGGISVPEKLAVTGYDATEEAIRSIPSITTYTSPTMQTGSDSMAMIHKKLTGEETIHTITDIGSLRVANSCGCKEDVEYIKRESINASCNSSQYTEFLNSNMMEGLVNCETLRDTLENICFNLYLLPDVCDFYLCLCKDWQNRSSAYGEKTQNELVEGYTDQMELAFEAKNYKEVQEFQLGYFDTSDMLPALDDERDHPLAFFFNPIHFNEFCLGYSVLTYGRKIKTFDITYRNWCRNINNALELLRVKEKLYRYATEDPLTHVLNRKGIETKINELMEKAVTEEKEFLLAMIDVDYLKSLNDSMGHSAGDYAICAVADTLKKICDNNEYCARIGGDEFIIVGYGDYPTDYEYILTERIKTALKIYNMDSDFNGNVSVSIGVNCEKINAATKYSDLLDIADKRMYKDKLSGRSI